MSSPASPAEVGDAYSLAPAVFASYFDILDATARADWPACTAAGLRSMAAGHSALRRQQSQAWALMSSSLDLAQAHARALAVLDGLAAGPSPLPEQARAAKDRLEASRQALDELPLARSGDELAIAGVTRGLLAQLHAEFNLAYLAGQEAAGGDAGALKAQLPAFAEAVRAPLLELYQRAVAGHDLLPALDAFVAGLERQLPLFLQQQARATRHFDHLLAQGTGGKAEALGRLLASAGLLAREVLALHAAAHRVGMELLKPRPSTEVTQLLQGASRMAFEGTLPDAPQVPLARLGDRADGDAVEIEGVVRAVRSGRSPDGKLISRLQLLDPSSGATAMAVVVFVQLRHAGLCPGQYCRLWGRYTTSSTLLGRAGVEVTRLPLQELARQQWRLAFAQLGRRWLQPRRNGAHMEWAWGAHLPDGEGAPARAGANELIYRPLVDN